MHRNVKLRSKTVLILAVLLAVAFSAAMLTFGRAEISEIVVKPAPAGTPVDGNGGLAADEKVFYDSVVPRMLRVSAEAQVVDKLGQERSRNLLELQTRGNRIDAEVKAINGYIASHTVPARFGPAMTLFEQGVSELTSAMAESKRGMLTFNWNLVGQQVVVFDRGATKVKAATEQLQKTAVLGTPVTK